MSDFIPEVTSGIDWTISRGYDTKFCHTCGFTIPVAGSTMLAKVIREMEEHERKCNKILFK